MKKTISTILFYLAFSNLFGQLYNDGAQIVIQENALVHIQDDFINQGGVITNDGIIEIGGNWENTVMTNPLTPERGTVELVGSDQTFGGDFPTLFNEVLIRDDQNVRLSSNIGIGSSIDLSNGVLELNTNTLHILNPLPNGLIFENGGVRAETSEDYGYVRWDVGEESNQNYTIPFNNNEDTFIPLSFDLIGQGEGDTGYILFSTFRTEEDNTPFPIDVNNIGVNGDSTGTSLVDRFWNIEAVDYTSVPLGSIGFSFDSANEAGGSNTILTDKLIAINWDEDLQIWNNIDENIANDNEVLSTTNNSYGDFTLWSNETSSVVDVNSFDDFQVYPNPASTTVTIHVEGIGNEKTQLRIVDIVGKDVHSSFLTENTNSITKEIDISHIPNGLFTIIVESKNHRSFRKLNKI